MPELDYNGRNLGTEIIMIKIIAINESRYFWRDFFISKKYLRKM